MFVADGTANTIYSYTLSTGFLVTSASYTASFDLTGLTKKQHQLLLIMMVQKCLLLMEQQVMLSI